MLVILAASLCAKWLLWRTVATIDPARFLRPDSAGYLASADALLLTGRFAVDAAQPNVAQSFRTPGYPVFLALLATVSGRQDPAMIAAVQIILSLATLALLFWLGLQLWQGTVAVLAATLLALDVASFAYTLLAVSETLFTLLLLLMAATLVQLCRAGQTRRGYWALATGLLLALATLVRPINYYLIVPLAGGIAWLGWRLAWPRRNYWQVLLLLTLPYLCLVGGWQARNYWLTGNPAFSTVTANNLYFYRAAGIIALRDEVSLADAQAALRADLPDLSGRALDDWLVQASVTVIRSQPLLAVRSAIQGGLTMLLGLGDGWVAALVDPQPAGGSALWALFGSTWATYWREWVAARPVAFMAFWLSAAQLFTLYAGNLLWWLAVIRRRLWVEPVHWLLWLVMFYLVLLSAGPEANSRLRVPLAPLLALYAAAGILHFLNSTKNHAHLDDPDQL